MQDRINRRRFIASSAAGSVALTSSVLSSAATGETTKEMHHEAARDIPIVDHADVVVCGAGPAGIAAAIAAGRTGAKTWLIEVNGCLGGTWTAGLLSWIIDSSEKPGLMREILTKLAERQASRSYGGSVGYDVEQMKLLLEQMCSAAGVRVLLHTRVVAACRDDANRLSLIATESKSGRQAVVSKVFIDATGDGDLAAFAGCGFDVGREGTGETQPMSMLCLLTGLNPEDVKPFVNHLSETVNGVGPKQRMFAEMERAGVSPSYAHPSLFCIRDNLFCLMANHEYGVAATDAAQISEATLRARAEVHKLVEALRGLGGIWQNILAVATPEHIGVREGRRIHGLYRVTADDLVQGKQHEDAVCRVRFGADVHSTNPDKNKAISQERVRAKPYDIPYRALIARDVDGLLLAGRCISGDFITHSSYRVTGNAVPMGEAAGTAAAVAAKTGRLPQSVPWKEIREAMGRPEDSPKG